MPIQLRFTALSQLHQGFFAREGAVRDLGAALGACTEHTVDVDVVWSQDQLEGRIVAQLPSGSSACEPRRVGDAVDLSPLVPLTRAVAAYRDDVSGKTDFRISAFRAGVDLVREGTICRVFAAGQHPPDGTRFDPCIQVNGVAACADGSRKEGVTSLRASDPAVDKQLRACFAR